MALDIQQHSISDAQGLSGKKSELKAGTESPGLQNSDLEGARKSSEVTETLTRYARIVRVFTAWYEVQYGDSVTPDVFNDEGVIGRYLQHCKARLSKSSVRRIRTVLQMAADEATHTRVISNAK